MDTISDINTWRWLAGLACLGLVLLVWVLLWAAALGDKQMTNAQRDRIARDFLSGQWHDRY